MTKLLLNDVELERSDVVANAVMNRQRNVAGGNSYEKELGFSPVDFLRERLRKCQHVAWLDLCCGTGRALIQAAELCRSSDLARYVSLVGVDLIPNFDPVPAGLDFLAFQAASLAEWRPGQAFDLISCVHGLHYVGDKLGIIHRATSWLEEGGRFVAHLDFSNLHVTNLKSARTQIGKQLRRAGIGYQSSRRLLACQGPIDARLPYRYLGAEDGAGPNYTGQPAIDSYYESTK
jgi:SAM-dependent methyltransferase